MLRTCTQRLSLMICLQEAAGGTYTRLSQGASAFGVQTLLCEAGPEDDEPCISVL